MVRARPALRPADRAGKFVPRGADRGRGRRDGRAVCRRPGVAPAREDLIRAVVSCFRSGYLATFVVSALQQMAICKGNGY